MDIPSVLLPRTKQYWAPKVGEDFTVMSSIEDTGYGGLPEYERVNIPLALAYTDFVPDQSGEIDRLSHQSCLHKLGKAIDRVILNGDPLQVIDGIECPEPQGILMDDNSVPVFLESGKHPFHSLYEMQYAANYCTGHRGVYILSHKFWSVIMHSWTTVDGPLRWATSQNNLFGCEVLLVDSGLDDFSQGNCVAAYGDLSQYVTAVSEPKTVYAMKDPRMSFPVMPVARMSVRFGGTPLHKKAFASLWVLDEDAINEEGVLSAKKR